MAIKKQKEDPKFIKGSRKGMGVYKTVKEKTTVGGIAKPYKYTTTSIDTTGYSKGKPSYKVKSVSGTSDKTGVGKVSSKSITTIPRSKVKSVLKSLK
jgi:hypothetical protein